jgi:mannan endo-1,4-beta-mannosidase
LANVKRRGQHRLAQPKGFGNAIQRHHATLVTSTIAIVVAVMAVTWIATQSPGHPAHVADSAPNSANLALPTTPNSYIGVYSDGVPNSFAGVTAFTVATGVKPRVILYYSGWFERFRTNFATDVAHNGAVPLVQMEPSGINLAALTSGRYDSYLSAFARDVRVYRHPVILSFGHEMNGHWYSWGHRHTSPTVFVAAWRHIVTLFRARGARNVTWMWTVNVIHSQSGVPSPSPWWPGSSYVTWVGIDGYYTDRSSIFASLFGPTIVAVRKLTRSPILIAETAAAPVADQSAKIADLFAGTRLYGLLGFVWFNVTNSGGQPFGIQSSAAFAAFRKGASTYVRPES